MSDFQHARFVVNPDAIVPAEERQRYRSLPAHVTVRGRDVEIQYDVEDTADGVIGVARLHLPEKMARTLSTDELPTLDRPLRFVVARGARGAARGATLDQLQEELDRPFTDEEISALDRQWTERREEHRDRKRHKAEAAARAPRTLDSLPVILSEAKNLLSPVDKQILRSLRSLRMTWGEEAHSARL